MKTASVWVAAAAVLMLVAGVADAARLGGARSFGAQRPSMTTPRVAPPAAAPAAPAQSLNGAAANPVMPRAPGAQPAAAAAGSARGAAAASGSRWLGPLAGIAAGIGLAAMLSHFGVSAGFADVLLLAGFAIGAIMLARLLVLRRAALAGASEPAARSPAARAADTSMFDARFGGAAPKPVSPAHWPPGFDAERFARQAIQQFRAVQRAYDHGDTAALSDVMTPELYTETVKDLRARGVHLPTAFDALDAEVVDVSIEADLYWVSVRFSGLSREDGASTAQPFDEVWNLSKPMDGSTGWLVAGIQQPVAA